MSITIIKWTQGSPLISVVTVNVDTTVTTAMNTILVDASGGNRIITLPAIASAQNHYFTIKKIDASANTVTIEANGAETIDGALNQVLAVQYESDTVVAPSTGTDWALV